MAGFVYYFLYYLIFALWWLVLGYVYRDREEAGKKLAKELKILGIAERPLVLAIPNGGLAVAVPIVKFLNADIDLLIVRKLQIPYNPEAGFGALTSLGTVMLNEALVARIGLNQAQIESAIQRTKKQIELRNLAYQGLINQFTPTNRYVILVDDGLASGYTMLAAIKSVRSFSPQKVIVAVPTASAGAITQVRELVDELICPHLGSAYVFAVADAYRNWYDVPDSEVKALLQQCRTTSRN